MLKGTINPGLTVKHQKERMGKVVCGKRGCHWQKGGVTPILGIEPHYAKTCFSII